MSDDCVVAWISLRVSTRPYVARTVYVIRLYLARLYRSYLLRARMCQRHTPYGSAWGILNVPMWRVGWRGVCVPCAAGLRARETENSWRPGERAHT